MHSIEEGHFKTGWEQQALMTFGAAAFRFQLLHDTSIKLPSEDDETTLPKALLLSLSGAAETLKTFSPAYTPTWDSSPGETTLTSSPSFYS